MAKLTEADVAAIRHARTIVIGTTATGGLIHCEGPDVAPDVFGAVLARYGVSGTPAHCVATASHREGTEDRPLRIIERADRDPVWRTVAGSLQAGEEILLFWESASNGILLRLVVAGAEDARAYLVACIPHKASAVVEPVPEPVAEPEPKRAEPKAEQGKSAPERTQRPVAAGVRRVSTSANVEHRVVTTIVLVALGATFALLAGLPVVHTVVAFLVLGGCTWWNRRTRTAPRAGAASRPIPSLRGRRAA